MKKVILLLCMMVMPLAAQERLTTPEWLELLATDAPGTVILMRHGQTDGKPYDGWTAEELNQRSGQRLLSASGVARCKRIGELLRAAGLQFTNVYSSPLVRAVDTSRLVFGQSAEIWQALASADINPADAEAELQQRMKEIHDGGSRAIWVTHSPNIHYLTGIAAADGEMLLADVVKENTKYRLVIKARWRLTE